MKDKILILDDLDNKKKLGATKAVAELRNRKKLEKIKEFCLRKSSILKMLPMNIKF